MADAASNLSLNNQKVNSSTVLAGGMILILAVMLLPLPVFLMDMLLAANITGALVMLFVALYLLRPVDFSVFPGLLLILTLFRLSLNIATTRLILGEGYSGEIIDAFGSFVVQGNYVVGAVVFLILVIINFMVITKGATRIAEVSARFTLDAMPGKQMAIDADLNAGLIDDREAQERRVQISQEADFYGAMDGASKFVRGDAVAGLLITGVNLIGGLLIGMLQRGLPLSEAAATYTLMTIGDGLVSQIPALLISVAAGIVVTRASTTSDLGQEIANQMFGDPRVLYFTAGVMGIMGLMPGLPFLPFTGMGLLMAFIARQINNAKNAELATVDTTIEEDMPSVEPEEKIENFLHPDAFEIEIGYGLIPLVDVEQGGNLLSRITTIRKSFAMEMGIIVPPIRIRDNIQLHANQYSFKIYGVEVAEGEVMVDYFMVVNPDPILGLQGVEMTEPTFGLPALWVNEREREKAEIGGNTVVEAPAVVATHLMETLREHCYKLLDRQEVQRMLNHLKETHSALVDEVVPTQVSLGVVQKVLKNLLREKIPVRNLVNILETIADYSNQSKDADILTEYVRSGLSETVTELLRQNGNSVVVATLEPRLEDHLIQSVKSGQGLTQNLGFAPNMVNALFQDIAEKVDLMSMQGASPVLLVSPLVRRHLKKFVETIFPNIFVVSFSELTMDTELKSVGSISFPHG
ncbi:MAG TPA: flagellar biosynthesis protein FlhA [Calditrichia bacterium]|nr:flagellar biosynthesis protein FlhA [Calditrichia bacterium]HQV30401.1 flagellar biosynthesis protein FlhA [Calditrichia bacterium]